jgi:hypothetical protein
MKVAHDSLMGPIDEKEIVRVAHEPAREHTGKRDDFKKRSKGKKYDKPDEKRTGGKTFKKKFEREYDKKSDKKKGYPKRDTGRRGNRPR